MCGILMLGIFFSIPGSLESTLGNSIIKKAIHAHGGIERLKNFDNVYQKSSVIMFKREKKILKTVESWTKANIYWKINDVFEEASKKPFIFEFEKAKGWKIVEEKKSQLNKSEIQEIKQTMYFSWIVRLHPLLEKKQFRNLYLGEIKWKNEIFQKVKVKYPNFEDVILYFEKTTGLLRRYSFQSEYNDLEYLIVYSRFLDIDGYRFPIRITTLLGGIVVMETRILEMRFLNVP